MEEMDEIYLTDEVLSDLQLLLFGESQKCFPEEWIEHGFIFKSFPPYGLIQSRPGPCAVIAAVQAWIIKELLYGHYGIDMNFYGLLRPGHDERRLALINALGRILWNSRSEKTVCVVRQCIETASSDVIPGRTNNGKVIVRYFRTYYCLLHYIKSNIDAFMGEGGIALFVYSLFLTRSVKVIREDMDFPDNHLIGKADDSYASQEIINLILIGQAVSGIFNDTKNIDGSLVLKGIPYKSNIGFLSALDRDVGTFYKDPIYPIWVIHISSHYSVLFGESKELLKTSGVFELLYIDSLSNDGDDEIRLTVDPNDPASVDESETENEAIQCILSKWPFSSVYVDRVDIYVTER